MIKHTPGPWNASYAYGGGTAIWIAPETGPAMVLQGAQCLRSDSVKHEQISVDQLSENAALMAASPDLLAALRRISLAAMARDNIMGDACALLAAQAELRDANKQAMEAIAKATRSAA